MSLYKNLVFAGAGVNGVAYSGVLSALEEHYNGQFLTGVQKVAGSSVGSIYAASVAAGATADYLSTKMLGVPFAQFASGSVIGDAYRIVEKMGMHDSTPLYEYVRGCLGEVTGDPDITFGGLLKDLVVTGTDLNSRQTVYFSRDTCPDMSVAVAVRISCSYPIFFEPVVWGGIVWCDGGLLDNYPVGVFDVGGAVNPETLGIRIANGSGSPGDPNTFRGYALSLIDALYYQAQNVHLGPADDLRSISIDVGGSSSLNFEITPAEKEVLVACGRQAGTAFFQR